MPRRKKTLLSRRSQRMLISLSIALLALIFYRGRFQELPESTDSSTTQTQQNPETDFERYNKKTFRVVNVVDGDTFDLEIPDLLNAKEHTRVRLWGVDTPETKNPNTPIMYYGPEASAYAKKQLLGNEVSIILEPHKNTRGKYGRLLCYAYVNLNEMFNENLLRDGYAYADERFDHIHYDRFQNLQKQAQRDQTGLWAKVKPSQWPQWYRQRHDPNYKN